MEIARKIEFDAGHRIPYHESKCSHFHGHRYTVWVVCEGPVQPDTGDSESGMVMDFGRIKSLMMEIIHDRFDHGFMVYIYDTEGRDALGQLGSGHKTILMGLIPTAENLAYHFYKQLVIPIERAYGKAVTLKRVAVYETPNSVATYEEG